MLKTIGSRLCGYILFALWFIGSASLNTRLFDLSDIVGDKWRDLADWLNMIRYDVEMIELENHTKKERAHIMLCKWQSMLGDNTTIEKIKTELKEIEEQNKVETIASKTLYCCGVAVVYLYCKFMFSGSLKLRLE